MRNREVFDKKTVVIVDDEPDIVELVSVHLKSAGFHVKGFLDAESLYDFIETDRPDLVILDLMLPDTDGLEICKYFKRKDELSSIPIIMLTARGDESDKILGLELGADDYVTKPFSPKELVARAKAVLRRPQIQDDSEIMKIGDDLVIDKKKHEVFVEGLSIELTSTEFKMLWMLAEKKGWVFTRDKILDYLWGQEKAVLDRTVDVHIKHLREKLGPAARLIKNVRGIGYKLEE
jgi:DNA-binding response OmpR family regulator